MKIEMTTAEGVTLKTAGTYCEEDIEVVPTFEIGGGGSADVQLFAPIIEVEKDQLIIDNVNGNFASEWQLYANDTLQATLTERTADLRNIFDEQGEYLIKLKALGELLLPSDYSNELTYWRRFYTVGLEYSIASNGTYALCDGIGTATDTDIIIAPEYEGLPVTEIGRGAFERLNITSVVIPDSVTSIGSDAFYNCTSLTSVVIGDSVTSIGSTVFSNCSALTSVTVPSSVTTIGGSAFYYCTSLTSVVFGNGNPYISSSMFNGCTALELVDFRRATQIPTLGTNVFANTSSTFKIIVPDSLYDEWIVATNWVVWADYIVKASEYTE